MPSPSARPRTKVVLPAPTSPMSSMTIGDLVCLLESLSSLDAKDSPKLSISCSE